MKGQDRGRQNSERLFALVIFELWRREYKICVWIANAYGSNFPYIGFEKHLQMQTQVVDIFPSLEPGGL